MLISQNIASRSTEIRANNNYLIDKAEEHNLKSALKKLNALDKKYEDLKSIILENKKQTKKQTKKN
jgi:hypothetical protein